MTAQDMILLLITLSITSLIVNETKHNGDLVKQNKKTLSIMKISMKTLSIMKPSMKTLRIKGIKKRSIT